MNLCTTQRLIIAMLSRITGGRGWAMAGLLLALGMAQAHGQFIFTESFTGSTDSAWIGVTGGTSPGPRLTANATPNAADPEYGQTQIDAPGNGWMRLATTTGNQANAITLNTELPSHNNTISITFDFTMWDGGATPADGLSVFAYDASVNGPFSTNGTFTVGANGGSLSYAQKSGVNGMPGGYFAVGIDTFGNWSSASEGRSGAYPTGNTSIDPGFMPNEIAVRGPGNGQTVGNYSYLVGTGGNNYVNGGNVAALNATTQNLEFGNYTTRPDQDASDFRRLQIILDSNNNLTVYLQVGYTGNLSSLFTVNMGNFTRPDLLGIGFGASTGGQQEVVEIRNVTLTSSGNFNTWYWSNADATAHLTWNDSSNLNWVGNGTVPGAGANTNSTVVFDSTNNLTGNYNVNITGSNKSVGGVYFSGPGSYVIAGNLGLNIVSATPGSPAFITLLNNPSGNANQTIGVTMNITGNNDLQVQNFVSQTLTLSGNLIMGNHNVEFNTAGNTVMSGIVSGTGNLTFDGLGITNLSGNNTFSGKTIIDANATLLLSNANALGSVAGNTTVASGGALALQGNLTFAAEPLNLSGSGAGVYDSGALVNVSGNNVWTGNITLAANSTIGAEAGNLTVSGNINGANNVLTFDVDNTTTVTASGIISGGTTQLVKSESGTLILSGVNTYGGGTTIREGTVQVQTSSSALGTANVTFGDSGTQSTDDLALVGAGSSNLTYANNLTVANFGNNVTIGGNTTGSNVVTTFSGLLTANRTVNLQETNTASGSSTSFTGNISGNGSIVKTQAGVVTLSGNNSFTGGLTLRDGTLQITGNNNTLGGGGTGNVTIGDSSTPAGDNLNLLAIGSANRTYANAITVNNYGNLVSIGGNTTGNNVLTTYSGALVLNRDVNLQETNANLTTSRTEFSGNISGAGNLTKTGAGLVLINSANNNSNMTGNVTVSTGTLRVAGGGAIGDLSGVTVNSGALFDVTANETVGSIAGAGNIALSNGNLLTAGGNNQTTTFSGVLSGGNAGSGFAKNGTGTLTLNGTNTYLGNTTVNAGVLQLGSNGAISSTNLTVIANSTVALNVAALNITNNLTLNGAGASGQPAALYNSSNGNTTWTGNLTQGSASSIGSAANTNLTLNGTLTGGNFDITFNGAGNVSLGTNVNSTLNSVNNITVSSGQLVTNANNRLSDNGTVTVASGATLNMNGFTDSVGGISGGGNITLGSGALTFGANGLDNTFGGLISGSGNLTQNGTSVTTFTSASAYSGGNLTIGSGTASTGGVQLGKNSVFGSSTNLTMNGGTFYVNGYADAFNKFTQTASSTVDFQGTSGGNLEFTAMNGTAGTLTIANWAGDLLAGNGGTRFQVTNATTTGLFANGTNITFAGWGTVSKVISLGGGLFEIVPDISSGTYFWRGNAGNVWSTGNEFVRNGSASNGPNASNTIAYFGDNAGNVSLPSTNMTIALANGRTVGTMILAGNASHPYNFDSDTTGTARTLTLQGTSMAFLTVSGNAANFIGGNTARQVNITLGSNLTIQDNSGNTGAGLTLGANASNTFTNGGFYTTVTGSGNTVIKSSMTGTGGLIINSSGPLTLTGNNTYTGNTTLTDGILRLNNGGNATVSSIGTGNFAINGGILDNTSGSTVTLGTNNKIIWGGNFEFLGTGDLNLGTGNVTLSGDTRGVTVDAGNLTMGGNISDGVNSYNMYKYGSGNLILTGNNAFNSLVISNGTVQISGNNNALGTGNVTIGDSATAAASNLTLLATGSANRTYADNIIVANYGNIVTLGGNTTGNNVVTTFSGALVLNHDVSLQETNSNLTTSRTDFTGNISGAGNITKTGAGLVQINSANNNNAMTGNVTISNGTLRVAGGGAIGDTSAVSVSVGALFDVTASETVGSIAGTGTISLANGTVLTAGGNNLSTLFVGIISGGNIASGLTKNGTGTLTLTNANTYTGNTTLNAGRLELAQNTSLGSAGNLVLNGGEIAGITTNRTISLPFLVNGSYSVGNSTDLTFSGNGSISTANTTETITVGSGINHTWSGVISGGNTAGGIVKDGAGKLILSNSASNFTSSLTINNGTVEVSNLSTTGLSIGNVAGGTSQLGKGNVTVSAGTLQLAANSSFNGTMTIAANYALTANGTGVFNLTNGNAGTNANFTQNGNINYSSSGNSTISVGRNYTMGANATITQTAGTLNLTANGNFSSSGNASPAVISVSNGGGLNINLSGGANNSLNLGTNDKIFSDGNTTVVSVIGTNTTNVVFNGNISVTNGGKVVVGNNALVNGSANTTYLGPGTRLDGGTGATKGVLEIQSGNLSFAGTTSYANTPGITINVTTNNSIVGTAANTSITNLGTLTKTGSGTTTIDSATVNNIQAQRILISGGTLLNGASDQIENNTGMELAGGTWATGGNDEVLGTLTLDSNSVLDLGDNSTVNNSVIHYADSSSTTWTTSSGNFLSVLNWSGNTSGNGTDQLYFGTSNTSLTTSQLGRILFYNPVGLTPGYYAAGILTSGEVVPIGPAVPVPEPSTYAAGGSLALLAAWWEWRRRKAKADAYAVKLK